MRNERLGTHLLGAFYAFLFSVATVGCIVTGWDLPDVSLVRLVFWCALFSILLPAGLYCRYGFWILMGLSAVSMVILMAGRVFREQAVSLLHTMTTHFRNVYSWPVLGDALTDKTDLVLILIAFTTAYSVSLCICCKLNIFFALPSGILPLVCCLLTTDTLPDVWVLYLMILGIAMLLVTDWMRTQMPEEFAGLTVRIFLPMAAALALLFALNPQEEYVNHAAALQKDTMEVVEKVQSAAESVVNGGISIADSLGKEKLNLRSAGPKTNLNYPVMRIRSPYSGILYLRGRDYDIYTGTAWEATEDRTETIPETVNPAGTLSVSTYTVRDVLYIPYYAGEDIQLTGGCLDNSDNLKSYQYAVSANPVRILGNHTEKSTVDSGYTVLPPETLEWATPMVWNILAGMPIGNTVKERAEVIGTYVRESAKYDLSTPSMGNTHDDFAKWFLEQSDTGYCVHFATAAAVLLRAAGIPARYVEGFMVGCQADQQTLVSNQSAHAWVEYYDKDTAAWTILEATPGEALVVGEVVPDKEEAEETETAEPEEAETASTETVPSENLSELPGITGSETDGGSSGTAHGGRPGTSGSTSGIPGETASEKIPFRIPDWMKTVFGILLCVSLIPITGELRRAGKAKRWNTGSPNEMALTRWKQSRQMAKLTKTELPGELNELALKATYSQHTLTKEELNRFELFRKQIRQKISEMPWYRKIFIRWIFVIG